MSLASKPLDARDVDLYWLREGVDDATLYGVVPGAGTPATLNILSEDLTGDRQVLRAELQKSNRLPGPMRSVGKGGTGKNLAVHLAPGADLEGMLEMLLCEEWTSDIAIAGVTFDAAAGDNSFNDSASGFVTAGVTAGTWIQVAGFTDPANNGRFRVDTVAAGKIVVSGGTLVTEAAGDSVTMNSFHLTNGTKLISAVAERHYTALTADGFQIIPGVAFASGTMAFDVQQLFTMAFTANHLGPSTRTDVTGMPGAAAAAVNIAEELSDATNNMANFRRDGTVFVPIQAFQWSNNNNMTPVNIAGQETPCWQSLGTAGLTGSMRALILDGGTLLDDIDAFTADRISYEIVPDAGSYTHDYVVEIHRLKFMRYSDFPNPGGEGPLIADLTWEAEEDLTLTGRWLTISKVPK